ncbi:MAG: hypothetical protein ACRD4I_16690, partial [Candidatus Angelobacter sp.]
MCAIFLLQTSPVRYHQHDCGLRSLETRFEYQKGENPFMDHRSSVPEMLFTRIKLVLAVWSNNGRH